MKHFHVTLERKDRSVREWSLWADALAIGSDPRGNLVLPIPVPAHAATIDRDGVVELSIGRLLVHDDTALWLSLWSKACDRMAMARRLEWREPGAHDRRRSIVLAAFSLFGILCVAGMHAIGSNPVRVANMEIPEDFLTIPLDQPKPPPPPPPAPQERERALRPDEQQRKDPDPRPSGGSTEMRTIQASRTSTPANVMTGSVMDQANKASDALLGELIDPDEKNLVDVMLAGNMGSMRRGDGGRGMRADDGDRMAALGNIGLGNGGRDGFGQGRDGAIRGPRQPGGGAFIATKPVVRAPRPTDITLGEDVGSRSPESILRVIRGAVGGFQYTYQKYLKKNDALGGKVSLKFTIAPSGDIVAIGVVNSNTGDGELDAEIMDKARRMKFEQIEKGNVTVTYAFVLDRQ